MPDWLQVVIFFVSALILLRLSGKKTISQMTPAETVTTIGLGTVLVHPLKSNNPWLDVYHGALIVLGLILVARIQLIVPRFMNWVTGEPLVLVKNNQILKSNLKKARMSVDELKMMLRTNSVNDLSKVKTATLEVNGKVSVELSSNDAYATKKDIEDIKQALLLMSDQLNVAPVFSTKSDNPESNLFSQAGRVEGQDPLQ